MQVLLRYQIVPDVGRHLTDNLARNMTKDEPSGAADPRDPFTGSNTHQGHDLETGMFARARTWTDLCGWLRLVRVLRLAASPPSLLLVAATLVIWCVGNRLMQGQFDVLGVFQSPKPNFDPTGLISSGVSLFSSLNPSSSWALFRSGDFKTVLILTIWTLLVWTPAILWLTRQGGLLTADRIMMSLETGWRHCLARTPYSWLMTLVPSTCSLVIAFGMVPLVWLSTWLPVLLLPCSLAIAIIAIPIGLLLFGSSFAVPLGIAAIANEKNPDLLDALSRGYEAVLRRPMHLILYSCFAAVVATVPIWLASGIATFATLAATEVSQKSGAPPLTMQTVAHFIAVIPLIVGITVVWGLVGGIYLLCRMACGGQEVEDLWVPEPPAKQPLPELRLESEDS